MEELSVGFGLEWLDCLDSKSDCEGWYIIDLAEVEVVGKESFDFVRMVALGWLDKGWC